MNQRQMRGLPPPREPTSNRTQRKEAAYGNERPP